MSTKQISELSLEERSLLCKYHDFVYTAEPWMRGFNTEYLTLLKTYTIIDNSDLELLKKLVDIGYTQSISRFCQEAIEEKLERSMQDYNRLGEIFSDSH
jgi:hypothetical protein